jgi:hypothetical protein
MIDAMLHILSKDTGEKQKGENEVTGKNLAEVPNMAQRTLLQYLSMDDWKIVAHLPAGCFIMVGSRAEVKSNIRQSDSLRRGSRRCDRPFEAIRRLKARA